MKKDLNTQAKEILEIAEKSGVQSNFFFVTTFQRYQVQLGILKKLQETLTEDNVLVTKEYVKGRGNVYTHPAVKEFNHTTDSANKTVTTLMNIIKGFGQQADKESEVDPLLEIINGGDVLE